MPTETDIEPTAQRDLTITRSFDAPRERVFAAWTDPKQLARWWGPDCFTNPVCELDARPGGRLRIVMRAPDGTDYPMSGIVQEIAAPGRLVLTSVAEGADGTPLLSALTTLDLAEQNGKTALTLRASAVGIAAEAPRMLEGMEAGWTQSLGRLSGLLAQA